MNRFFKMKFTKKNNFCERTEFFAMKTACEPSLKLAFASVSGPNLLNQSNWLFGLTETVSIIKGTTKVHKPWQFYG